MSELFTIEAQRFVADLNDLLRRTVAKDAQLEVHLDRDALQALVGFGTADGLRLGTIPVRVSDRGHAHLLVSFDLTLDAERHHLAVRKSTFGLYLLQDRREPLFRYEFDRDKTRFTQAHLHVHGQSHALGRLYALAGKTDAAEMYRLHLPVGGKRFRPSLEDVLECLFLEGLLRPLPGWEAAVGAHRRRYQHIQLRAAIRREPDVALDALRELGVLEQS